MTSAALPLPAAAASPGRAAPSARRGVPAMRLLEAVAYVLLALTIITICVTFLKPSPYDFTAIASMGLWIALGIRIHRAMVPFLGLLLLYHLGLLMALVPYFDEANPVEWTFQSVYLMCTAIFFAMFCAGETARRVTFILNAYVASSVFAAAAGVLVYFDLLGE